MVRNQTETDKRIKRSSAEINDEKISRWKTSAPARTREVLRKLKVLGNCSNKSLYEYSEDDVKKIFKAIESQLRDVRSKFRPSKKDAEVFDL